MKIKKKGFTLAEVLITLGIIGVVVAMTIPTLIQNANSAKFSAQYLLTGHLLGRAFCHCERKRGSPANLGDFIRSEVD